MNFLKRLRVLPALLGVAATLVALGSHLLGRPGGAPPISVAPTADARPGGARLTDELAVTKFSKTPVLTYQPRDGEMLFAWQIQPTVAASTTSVTASGSVTASNTRIRPMTSSRMPIPIPMRALSSE